MLDVRCRVVVCFFGALSEHRLRLVNKSLISRLLCSPSILPAQMGKQVLEVGPGTGNLTVKLLERAKKVRFSSVRSWGGI